MEASEWELRSFRNLPEVFKNKQYAHLPEQAQIEFWRLEGRLSPENLTCDGECSVAEVNRRAREVWRAWRALEKKYKVKVEPYY